MHSVDLTEMQMHTIIAALDGLRGDYYDISQEYETIILALQAQMKGTNDA